VIGKQAVGDALTALGIREDPHHPESSSELFEQALNDVGRSDDAVMFDGAFEELQQLINVPG
jgi:hypothetical protein